MIMIEFVPVSVKKKSSGKNYKSVVIQDMLSTLMLKPATSKTKLNGAQSLTPKEQEAADIMQSLKESKKTSKRQPSIEGLNKGTGSKLGVPDESTVISPTSSEGSGAKLGVPDKDKDITKLKVILEWGDEQDSEFFDDVEKDDKDGDTDDEGDDHVSDKQDADDKDDKTESDEDEIYKYKTRVRKDKDVKMKDAKVEESGKGEEKVTDAAKVEAKKTSEAKDDAKKTEIPSLSSSLSVSLGFGDQFLKFSSDSSLVSIVKDFVVADYLLELTKKQTPTAEQESEKSPSEILKIKKEQAKSQKNSHFTIKYTDKAAIEDKSASTKETTEEPIAEVVMDDAGDDVARDDNPSEDTSEPKTSKTLNTELFKQPLRPPTPDLDWNKRQVILDQPAQHWFNQMVSASKDPLTFNDLMAIPIDFLKYVFNGVKIENLTQDILLGRAFNLLKRTCSSSIKLEYNFQEYFNALTDKLDWNNPERDRYPFDLSKPLPLQGPQGHPTVTAVSKISKQNVYSTKAILGVKSVNVKKLHGYGHLEEIVMKTSDQQLYKFKENDFVDLHLNDIKDMRLLVVQHKVFHLDGSDIVDLIVAIRMFTRSLILKRRVEDLQLGVESY
uniref:Uncharacterized protein n=1 Tax=Tanacetum cinerariifolium TaxID=118510 RepID=A0A6L2JDS0_TANCI|nr:hypothetical protein [Tanacetum cinerariifolium]